MHQLLDRSYPSSCENGVQQDVCENSPGVGRGFQADSDSQPAESRHIVVHHFHNIGNEFIICYPQTKKNEFR